jgi:hypothetical protein
MDPAAIRAFAASSATAGEALWLAEVRLDGGTPFPAAITDPRGAPSLVPGGENDQGELAVRVRKELMEERPALQQKLEWKRPEDAAWRVDAWRISEVSGHDCDAVWLVKCEPWN